MRKLIYAMNLTLDGCCDHTKGEGTDDVLQYHGQLLNEADVLLYGRVTYQLMVPYWPDLAKSQDDTKETNAFAKSFDAVKQIVVFSKTLDKVEGSKTRIIRTGLKEEILKLKQEEGKSIVVGGVDLASQLVQLGLVDEYHFLYQPNIVGEGRRLWDDVSLPEKLRLKLADSKVLSTGGIALRYLKT
ncbi:MAG: dihydrofolate reductase family protein [Bacteroidota bacterium]